MRSVQCCISWRSAPFPVFSVADNSAPLYDRKQNMVPWKFESNPGWPPAFAWACIAVGLTLGIGFARGQDYPNRPIRIIASGVGSGGDIGARLIGHGIAGPLGQQVIVDNRGGVIAGLTVAKAPADGYTLLLQSATLWVGPLLQKDSPYDAEKDFSPITLVASETNVVVVHPSVPAKTVKELIALARARPGALNYASGASGSSNHLAGELFKAMAGVNIVRISYKGIGLALNELLGGQVHMSFGTVGAVAPHISSGRLRGLAVTSARPSGLFPELPTAAASGLPGYESGSSYGLLAPARTPAAIITRLNQETVRVINQTEVKERFLASGSEPVGSSPEALAATIRSEIAKWSKLINDADIRAD
jgi:tripartite-type tricarboxylate transporter receptor subunit TctC